MVPIRYKRSYKIRSTYLRNPNDFNLERSNPIGLFTLSSAELTASVPYMLGLPCFCSLVCFLVHKEAQILPKTRTPFLSHRATIHNAIIMKIVYILARILGGGGDAEHVHKVQIQHHGIKEIHTAHLYLYLSTDGFKPPEKYVYRLVYI